VPSSAAHLTTTTYRLFGLDVQSDQTIPGLPPATGGAGAPIDVVLNPEGPWAELVVEATAGRALERFEHARGEGEDPRVFASENASLFSYAYDDGTEFLIDLAADRVWGKTPEGQTLDDTAVYLIGPVLGFIARSRGVLCLHASAVTLGGGAVAFVGPAGAGKSTLAAAFATAGVPVLTDDIAALTPGDGGYAVEPGSSFLRLWPQSTSVTAAEGELPRLAADWDKRYVDLTERPYSFAAEPAPLGTIYLLRDSAGAPPSVRDISEPEAVLSLVGNTYANYMLTPDQRAHELRSLSRLVSRVDVRVLRLPDDLAVLPAVMDVVRADTSSRAGLA
jgi:hypothetical protein